MRSASRQPLSASRQALHSSITGGRHPSFQQLLGVNASSTETRSPSAVPDIPNTKSLWRWYCKRWLTVSESHEVPQVEWYDPAPLLSFRVLCAISGTVLKNPLFWVEELLVMLVFGIVTGGCYFYNEAHKEHMYDQGWIQDETDIRNLCDLLSTMATLMLGFFTSINVARWWRLRTEGIGCMWSACSQLCLFISESVTQDEQVLSAIRRYTRASLILIFMKQRGYSDKLGILAERGVLTNDEVGRLKIWNNNLAESIWTWTARIVYMLWEQGLIKSEFQLVFLLERVNIGRAGCACICAQLGTPIPMQYVHFIGLMVKIHNLGVALLMGYLVASDIVLQRDLLPATISLRVLLLSGLYNATLFINEEIMNPFDGDMMDFPMSKYEKAIESDGSSYVNAVKHLPSWMNQWSTRNYVKSQAAKSRSLDAANAELDRYLSKDNLDV